MERLKAKPKARGNVISDDNMTFAEQKNIKIGYKIGDGNFADVYRARLSDKDIALKITYKSQVQSSTLKSEIEVLKILKEKPNKNVVRMIDITENSENSQVWILMQWFSAEDMFAIQRRQLAPFAETVAKRYFRQMVAGLEFMHSLHIVHRDIKPHNILVGRQDNSDSEPEVIKYIDFGFAKVVREAQNQALCSSHKGSQIYMAPELMSDKHIEYDAFKSDIYSLAIVLYEMLFDVLPFGTSDFGSDRSDRNELMVKLKENLIIKYPEHIDISNSAKQLIEGMISSDPEKRIPLKDIANSQWLNID